MALAAESAAGPIGRKDLFVLLFKLHSACAEVKDLVLKENVNTSLEFANCVLHCQQSCRCFIS